VTLEEDRKLFIKAAKAAGYDITQHEGMNFFVCPSTAKAWYIWKVARGTA
jgi:uncharacterized protein YmfQ (DUF2313 family)